MRIKGLSLHRPWAFAYTYDESVYGMNQARILNTKYQIWGCEYIALHGSRTWSDNTFDLIKAWLGVNEDLRAMRLYQDAIFAIAKLEKCTTAKDVRPDQAIWALDGLVYELSDFRLLKDPIQVGGGLFPWTISGPLLEKVLQAYRASEVSVPREKKPLKVELYTDGSNRGQPGPGGYGVVMRCGSHEKELSGPIVSATNNIAELTAVIKGLEALDRPCYVKLVSDSMYVVNGVNRWLMQWKSKGWKKPEKNRELWFRLDDLINYHKEVKAYHVKGHSGHPENERADKLAGDASQAEKERQANAK